MKATDEEYRYHRRMLDPSDLTAFAAFAEWIYDELVRRTKIQVPPGADSALVEEAAGSALLEYNDAPHRYDPDANGLLHYLAMAAYRDYLNAAAKERRRRALPLTNASGADLDIVDDTQAVERLFHQLELEPLLQAIDQAFSNPIDRQVVALLLEGERSYHTYAVVLGITHLPIDTRDVHVKRAKDRIAKRLRRIVSKSYDA